MTHVFKINLIRIVVLVLASLPWCVTKAWTESFAVLDFSKYDAHVLRTSDFCERFLTDLQHKPERIAIIPPVVETNDFNHPKMASYLAGCDKEEFTTLRPSSSQRIITEEGKVAWVEFATDEDHPPAAITDRAIDDYAIYEIHPDPAKSLTDLLLYVGPYYKIVEEDDVQDRAEREFTDGGSVFEIIQPGCKMVGTIGVHGIPKTASDLKRRVEMINYEDSVYLMSLTSPTQAIHLIKLLGEGRTNFVCAYFKER